MHSENTDVVIHEEVRIRAFALGEDRYLCVAIGPTSAAAVIHVSDPDSFWRRFSEAMETLFSGNASRKDSEQELKALGCELFLRLLPEPLERCLMRSHEIAVSADRRLRVLFDLDHLGLGHEGEGEPSLGALPVELLRSPQAHPLGVVVETPTIAIVRSLPGLPGNRARLPQPTDKFERLQLLAVFSQPQNADSPGQYLLPNARRELEELVKRAPAVLMVPDPCLHTLGLSVTDFRTAASPANLRAKLDAIDDLGQPSALLISAHGVPGAAGVAQLVLEADDGSPVFMGGDQLAQWLGGIQRLRLVVLNLCFGGMTAGAEPFSGLAQALIATGIPVVVAMQTAVSEDGAAAFSPAFFDAVWHNKSVEDAVSAGRSALSLAGSPIEACVPVLYRLDAPNEYRGGWLFKVQDRLVLEGELPDPYLKLHLKQLKGPSPASVLYHRLMGNWPRARDEARVIVQAHGVDAATREANESVVAQAELESAAGEIAAICTYLRTSDVSAPLARQLRGVRQRVSGAELTRLVLGPLLREVGRRCISASLNEAARLLSAPGEAHPELDRAQSMLDEFSTVFDDETTCALEQRRLFYIRGQLHASARAWKDARRAFQEAGEYLGGAYLDAAKRALYAEAREREGDHWAESAAIYERVGTLLDARYRLAFARAQLAVQESDSPDWSEVARQCGIATGIPDLGAEAARFRARAEHLEIAAAARHSSSSSPPAWDVAAEKWAELVRREVVRVEGCADDTNAECVHARMQAAAAADEWGGVRDEAVEIPAGNAPDLLAVIRHLSDYAKGRLMERMEPPQWAAAVMLFARLPDDFLDAAPRRLYAEANDHCQSLDWARAVRAHDALLALEQTSFERASVSREREYARGRGEEDAGDWAEAVQAYGEISDFRDAEQRSAYARLRILVQDGQWTEAIKQDESLPDSDRDVAEIRAYARGRLLESERRWDEAAVAFEKGVPFSNARSRHLHATARRCEEGGAWDEAIELYEQVGDDIDASDRAQRLRSLVDDLPWTRSLRAEHIVIDPRAEQARLSPYASFHSVGLGPDSPLDGFRDALGELRSGGDTSPRARADWDTLRQLIRPQGKSGRMDTDAFFYAVDFAPARKWISELDAVPTESDFRDSFPREALVIDALSEDEDKRDRARERWLDMLTEDPTDAESAHRLAVASYWEAISCGLGGGADQARELWDVAVGAWTMVLGDLPYWTRWRRRREELYRAEIRDGQLTELLSRIGERLRGDLSEATRGAGSTEGGELELNLDIEAEGARRLGAHGGLPMSNGGSLVAGRSYLERTGLMEKLAGFVADQAAGAQDAQRALRVSFSSLAQAHVLFQQDQPIRALAFVPALEDEALPRDFDEPCYERLSEPGVSYQEDRTTLKSRIHLAIAREALQQGAPGLDEALDHWRSAFSLVPAGALDEEVVSTILGRTEALQRVGGEERGERLEEAMRLLEQGRELLDSGRLNGKCAEIYADYGVWIGSGRYAFGEDPDFEDAAAFLRRAVSLSPGSIHARDNLSRALTNGARNWEGPSDSQKPLTLLLEATVALDEGLKLSADPRLRFALSSTLEALEDRVLSDLPLEQLANLIALRGEGGTVVPWRDVDGLPGDLGPLLRAIEELRDSHSASDLQLVIDLLRSKVEPS